MDEAPIKLTRAVPTVLAMAAVEHASEQGERTRPVVVSRQPVIDSSRRVAGYRIAYATLDGGTPARPTGAEAVRLFDDVFSVVGLADLVGDSLAHLPVSRELLIAVGVPPVRPDRVVLRVGYDDALAPGVAAVLEQAAGRGYTLQLDGLPGREFDLDLLTLFGTVDIDMGRWTAADAAAVLPAIRQRRARALASGLRDHAEREACQELGFEWFAGPFYTTATVVAGRQIPVGNLSTLVEMTRLQGATVTLEELVVVIERDIGLSVRLLRYINSAYFGLARTVSSIQQAVMLLGTRGVARWALLIAVLASTPRASRELAVMALTRARMCEQASAGHPELDPAPLFTVGLLSVVDVLVGRPLEEVVAELPLTPEIADALLHRSGLIGRILNAVIAYEQGSFADPVLVGELPYCLVSYYGALDWARTTLSVAA